MSLTLSTAYVTLFDSEVKQAYQASSVLRDTVRLRSGVEGNTYKFPKIGKGSATLRVPQADITPLGVAHSQVSVSMTDFSAGEYSDIFMQAKVNFDERRELVEVVSKAIGRRLDQMIIDAIDGAGTSLTVANSIGGSNTNLNVDKLLKAKQLMDTKNVPAEDRYILCHAKSMQGLLDEADVKSIDFNTTKVLATGSLKSFLGFTFITIGDRDEGGLAVDGSSDRTVLAWHKSSVGLAENMSQKTEINYIPEKASFLVNSMFSAGAVGIDADGIVEITCRES
jgi:hypothetical protein